MEATSHPISCLQSEASSPRQDQPCFFFWRLAAQDSLLKEIYEVLQTFISSKSSLGEDLYETPDPFILHFAFFVRCQFSLAAFGQAKLDDLSDDNHPNKQVMLTLPKFNIAPDSP